MTQAIPDHVAPKGPRARGIALMGWVLLGLGLTITILAAIALLRAWSTRDVAGGRIGSALLAAGVCVAVCGAARARLGRAPQSPAGPSSRGPSQVEAELGVGALPRLGEILVHKYHLISERDLKRALTRQTKGVPRPLGEILVGMGRITWRELAVALEDQLGYGDPWKQG